MKRILSLILVIILCLSLSVSVFAADNDINSPGHIPGGGTGDGDNPGGGNDGGSGTTSPKTGCVALVSLAAAACTAGGISIITGSKAKK